MEINDPMNIFKMIIALTEIAMEKTIYICKSDNDIEFSLPFFMKNLKNEAYNLCTSDDIVYDSQELIKDIDIDFDYESVKSSEDSNLDEQSPFDLNSSLNKYLNDNREENSEENSEEEISDDSGEYEISFDIPIHDIIKSIEENYDKQAMEKYGTVGRIVGELNLIDKIWEEWIPDNHAGRVIKNMVNSFEKDWLQ